jgi:pimeloyl-ACP methyl ester carboxylesterase
MTARGETTRHRIPVTDGEEVVAVHHHGPSDWWLVFCHGFRSDKTGSYERRCRRAVGEGYHAVRFDFRGCGESDGAFVDQTLTDKLADLAAVVDHFDPGSYALFGSSFGGTVALHAVTGDDRVTAVATRAPVTDTSAMDDYREAVEREGVCAFEDGRRVDERFFADLDGYHFQDVADALAVPVAIFHGARDASVPVGDSFEAARALGTDVLVEKFADEGHRFSEDAEQRMRDRLFEWLATVPEG